MKTSESLKEIAKALNKAQSEMGGATKDAKNPFFKSNYSDLASIMQAIAIPFADNGLSFVQGAEFENDLISVATRVMHISGEWIEATTQLPAVKRDPQAYGSALTYAKRYGLQALAGVPSVDDDAQYASASTAKHQEEEIARGIEHDICAINNCKNMDELVSVFKASNHQKAITPAKDTMKAHFTNQPKDVVA